MLQLHKRARALPPQPPPPPPPPLSPLPASPVSVRVVLPRNYYANMRAHVCAPKTTAAAGEVMQCKVHVFLLARRLLLILTASLARVLLVESVESRESGLLIFGHAANTRLRMQKARFQLKASFMTRCIGCASALLAAAAAAFSIALSRANAVTAATATTATAAASAANVNSNEVIGGTMSRTIIVCMSIALGQPIIRCTSQLMHLAFRTSLPFDGRIYVEGRENDQRCIYDGENTTNPSLQLPILPCAIIEESSQNMASRRMQSPLTIASIFCFFCFSEASAFGRIFASIFIKYEATMQQPSRLLVIAFQVLITGSSQVMRVDCEGLTKSELLDGVSGVRVKDFYPRRCQFVRAHLMDLQTKNKELTMHFKSRQSRMTRHKLGLFAQKGGLKLCVKQNIWKFLGFKIF